MITNTVLFLKHLLHTVPAFLQFSTRNVRPKVHFVTLRFICECCHFEEILQLFTGAISMNNEMRANNFPAKW